MACQSTLFLLKTLITSHDNIEAKPSAFTGFALTSRDPLNQPLKATLRSTLGPTPSTPPPTSVSRASLLQAPRLTGAHPPPVSGRHRPHPGLPPTVPSLPGRPPASSHLPYGSDLPADASPRFQHVPKRPSRPPQSTQRPSLKMAERPPPAAASCPALPRTHLRRRAEPLTNGEPRWPAHRGEGLSRRPPLSAPLKPSPPEEQPPSPRISHQAHAERQHAPAYGLRHARLGPRL